MGKTGGHRGFSASTQPMCPSAPSRVAVTVAEIEDKFLAAMG
jgi:hypothetical protein